MMSWSAIFGLEVSDRGTNTAVSEPVKAEAGDGIVLPFYESMTLLAIVYLPPKAYMEDTLGTYFGCSNSITSCQQRSCYLLWICFRVSVAEGSIFSYVLQVR